MKNLLFVILVFSVYSVSAQIKYNTGNSQLDSDLNLLDARVGADLGSFKVDMRVSYNITEKKFDYMYGSLKMAPGEICLALEIARISKTSLDQVLLIYESHKSKGWGYIAKQAGIKPGSSEFHELKNGISSGKKKQKNKNKTKGKGNKKKK